jgi:AefR-like transcriptional repressor, C-terminal domain
MPEDLPQLRDRETLARVLSSFGARLLREVSDPTVVAVFRLAIAEAERNPKVAQALDTIGQDKRRRNRFFRRKCCPGSSARACGGGRPGRNQ